MTVALLALIAWLLSTLLGSSSQTGLAVFLVEGHVTLRRVEVADRRTRRLINSSILGSIRLRSRLLFLLLVERFDLFQYREVAFPGHEHLE